MNTLLRYGITVLSLIACSSSTDPNTTTIEPVHFNDLTNTAGLDFAHFNGFSGEYYYLETFGAGAAFLDYDGDQDLDLYLVNGTYLEGLPPDPLPRNRLYQNQGRGTFRNVSATTGADDSGYGFGVAAADYDADGDQDLFVANFGPNVLYRNDGGIFTQTKTGVEDPRWSTSAGYLDYDRDGDLDLFVANYVEFSLANNIICKKGKTQSYCEPSAYAPIGDILYRNDSGYFTDISRQAGISLAGRGLGVAFADYDRDGDTDIYVANDGTMNFLYENQAGTFTEIGLSTGTRYDEHGHAEAGMGVDFGDYDRDDDMDLFVTNFAFETNTLYQNDGQGQFDIASDRLGLGEASFRPLGFGTRFLDYDNDRDLDLFVANGHVMDVVAEWDSTQTYHQTNQMLRNENGQRFIDVSANLGPAFAQANVGRGTAVADYDDDGDLDLLVTTVADRPRLLRNEGGNHNHWLQILLVGRTHPDAIGARVVVVTGEIRQILERQSGGSYLSSHDPRLHFGLGQATKAQIEITWPSGQIQMLTDIAADQVLRIVEP